MTKKAHVGKEFTPIADQNMVTITKTKRGNISLNSWLNGHVHLRRKKSGGEDYFAEQKDRRKIEDKLCQERFGKNWDEINWEVKEDVRTTFVIRGGKILSKTTRDYNFSSEGLERKQKASRERAERKRVSRSSPSHNRKNENAYPIPHPPMVTPLSQFPSNNMKNYPTHNNNMNQPSQFHSNNMTFMNNNNNNNTNQRTPNLPQQRTVTSKKRKLEYDEDMLLDDPEEEESFKPELVSIYPKSGDKKGDDYVDVHLKLPNCIIEEKYLETFKYKLVIKFGDKEANIISKLKPSFRENRLNKMKRELPEGSDIIGELSENSNFTAIVLSPSSDVAGEVVVSVSYFVKFESKSRITFTYTDASEEIPSSVESSQRTTTSTDDDLQFDWDDFGANTTTTGLPDVGDELLDLETILFYTIGKNDFEGVKKLVEEKKVDIWYVDDIGHRASFYAKRYGFSEIHEYLITKEQEQEQEQETKKKVSEEEDEIKEEVTKDEETKTTTTTEEVKEEEVKEEDDDKSIPPEYLNNFKFACRFNCRNAMDYEVDEDGHGCFTHVCKSRSRKCKMKQKRIDSFQSFEHKVAGQKRHKCTIDILKKGFCSHQECPVKNLKGSTRVKVGERKIEVISRI